MKQSLPLPATAIEIARCTMLFQLSNVPAHRAPPLDLSKVVGMPAARIIATIPLEPSARIVGMDPSFASPHFEWLRCLDAEIIQGSAVPVFRKFRPREPARWKLFLAIGHVFSTKHAEREHPSRAQLWRKPRAKFAPYRFRPIIRIPLLHFVVNEDANRFHYPPGRSTPAACTWLMITRTRRYSGLCMTETIQPIPNRS
jgi:hypothetical protein